MLNLQKGKDDLEFVKNCAFSKLNNSENEEILLSVKPLFQVQIQAPRGRFCLQ